MARPTLKGEYAKAPVTMPIDAIVDLEKAIVDYQNGNNIGTYDLVNYFYQWLGDIRRGSTTNKQVRDLDEALEILEHILTEPAFYLNNRTLYSEYYVSVKLHMEMGNYGGSSDTLIQSFHAFYQCLNMGKLCLIGPDHLNGFVQTAKDDVPKRVNAIRLKAYNGQYLCAQNGGGEAVTANRTTAAEWEQFIIQKVQGSGEIKSEDKVSLRCYNGMYLCAENGGGRQVVANRQKMDVWETFTVEIVKTVIPFSARGSDISKLTIWVGFDYDTIQGIFYSTLDPLQRDFGYFPIYDAAAPLVGIYIEYEIIRFPYEGKQWKIELWKGQYGITIGAEIGIYVGQFQINTKYNTFDDKINALLAYMGNDTACAEDRNMLEMSFELKRNGHHVFTRDSSNPASNGVKKHWWLTGFKPGIFAKASDLSMNIKIVLKDEKMCENFVSSLKRLGYRDIKINEKTFEVSFVFNKPKMSQPF